MSSSRSDDGVHDYAYALRNALKLLDNSNALSERDKGLIRDLIT
jgi:hypothetical protein